MTTIRYSFPIDWVHWAILARCCLQGSHRGAERAVPVEEREERQHPRRFRVHAPGPPGPGYEGARLGAAASATTGLHYRRHAQGDRPRPPARGRLRIRRARGTQPRPPPTHSILLLCFSFSAGEPPLTWAHGRGRTSTFYTPRRRRTSGCRSRAATVGWLLSPPYPSTLCPHLPLAFVLYTVGQRLN